MAATIKTCRINICKTAIVLSALFIAASCSNTRFLPEGELLYTGGTVKIEAMDMKRKQRKALEKELKGLIRPKPNRSFLGLRPKLYIYNIAGKPKKEKGFRNWLREKVGEPPVLFSQVDLDYNADVLQNYAENKGYFKAKVAADSTRKGKRAKSNFVVTPGVRYTIKSVTYPSDSTASDLDSTIARTQRRSRLKVGDGYDLDIIKDERVRIDNRLKQKGYFYFSPDYIKVQVDSTIGDHKVDLFVKVKEDTPEGAKIVYRINDIFIYPNFSVRRDTVGIDSTNVTVYKDFTIIDKEGLFKPRIFDRTMYFKKGDVYSRTNHNLTLNRLTNLGVFKFVKNDFKVVDDEAGDKLDAFYYLTPLPKKSIRVEVLGKTNSANYTGTELNVNWSNRNTFKGAELLQITGFGGLEVQVSGQNKGFNVYRIGGETSLVWPRFISPFKLKSASGFMPKTKATLGYEYQLRQQLYSLNSFTGSFSYLWKENIRKEHELKVTEVTYVNPGHVTDLYRERIIEDRSLAKVIEQQLIFGPVYSYTYTNTMRKRLKNTIYFRGVLDVAGTIAGIATGANVQKGDTTKVFGVPFSQYVKAEADFRHYYKFSENTQLASRLIAGYGYAYGNSSSLPFIKQFFIGGTNSIRAFRARSIGPGTYREEVGEDDFLPDQSGDIKLEINTELRQKLFSIVHGAIFVDAGNIWLRNDDAADPKPGAKFSGDFIKELAVGTGAGLRFDLSFLVLRTDLAFPIRKPYLPEGNRWVFDRINFGSSSWRKENLVFNLAIGYPF